LWGEKNGGELTHWTPYFGEDWLKFFATKILDARYERADVVEVVKGLTHLNAHQKADLR
jgi:hypothetical protein